MKPMKLDEITKRNVLLLLLMSIIGFSNAQLTGTFDTTINTLCLGAECNWQGPSILINEIQVSPTSGDGSISGTASGTARGEWIELYNPDLCNPVDISCYYLGNAAMGSLSVVGGGFQLPQGTIVPPAGFCLVRGVNAPAVPPANLVQNGGNVVEVVVPGNITDNGVCSGSGGTRLWFPNAGGWFAFYDANGVPQDAISWGNQNGINVAPCVPTNGSCNTGVTSLASYNNIPANRKQVIYSVPGDVPVNDNTIRRMPDGGSWVVNTKNTPGTIGACNDPADCFVPGASTCAGTATINVGNGSGDYSYLWDDSESQTTQTAVGLCEGTYTVTVTDNVSGETQDFTVDIENLELEPTIIDSEQPICTSNGSILIGSGTLGASPYTYSVNGGTFESNGGSYPDLTAGTYDFIVRDNNGCTGEISQTLTVIDLELNPTIIDAVQPICTTTGSISVSPGTIGTGPYTFSMNGGAFENTGGSYPDLTAGNYDFVVQDDNGCTGNISQALIDNGNINIDTVLITPPSCIDIADASATVVVSDGTAPFTFTWLDGGGNTIPGSGSGSTINNLGVGSYSVEVVDVNGCTDTYSYMILANPNPDPSFTLTDFCDGESNQAINIASPGGTFAFNPAVNDGAMIDPATGSIINGVPGTTYSVEYTVANGCSSSIQTVTIHPIPDVSFTASPTTGTPPLNVDLINTSDGLGSDSYEWIIGPSAIFYDDQIVDPFIFNEVGEYEIVLTAENQGGCTNSTSIIIEVFYPDMIYVIPNVFTPNGDGSNDFFKFVNFDFIKEIDVIILNRWGNLVFEYKGNQPASLNWNGHVNNTGAECTDGVYFYKMELTGFNGDVVQEHGYVHLSREK